MCIFSSLLYLNAKYLHVIGPNHIRITWCSLIFSSAKQSTTEVRALLKWFFTGHASSRQLIQDIYDQLTMLMPNSCIVAESYVVRYQHTTMLFVYFIWREHKIAQILHWGTTKQIATGVIDNYWKFFPSVKYCPQSLNLGTIYQPQGKFLNTDPYAAPPWLATLS